MSQSSPQNIFYSYKILNIKLPYKKLHCYAILILTYGGSDTFATWSLISY